MLILHTCNELFYVFNKRKMSIDTQTIITDIVMFLSQINWNVHPSKFNYDRFSIFACSYHVLCLFFLCCCYISLPFKHFIMTKVFLSLSNSFVTRIQKCVINRNCICSGCNMLYGYIEVFDKIKPNTIIVVSFILIIHINKFRICPCGKVDCCWSIKTIFPVKL